MAVLGSVIEDTSTDLNLEELFNESLRCEARHTVNNILECSIEVVARFSSCIRHNILVCQNVVDGLPLLGPNQCSECGRRVSECWQIIPI